MKQVEMPISPNGDQLPDYKRLSTGELGKIVGDLPTKRRVECEAIDESQTEPEQNPIDVETREMDISELPFIPIDE